MQVATLPKAAAGPLHPSSPALTSDPPWDPPEASQSSSQRPLIAEIQSPEPAQIEAPRTSRLAIASLVLSVLWIGGLGSLLAVIFAVVARQHLRETGPWEGGEELARAGLILGIVGLVGTVVLFGIGVNQGPSDNTAFPHIPAEHLRIVSVARIGQQISLRRNTNAYSSGIARVTVLSLTVPAVSQESDVQPTQGYELAIAQAQFCAGPVTVGNPPSVELLVGHDVVVGDPVGDAQVPGLDQIPSIDANQCVTGYQTFELADGTTPSAVVFTDGDASSTYEWTR